MTTARLLADLAHANQARRKERPMTTWNEETTFKHAGFRTIKAFRILGNIGCVFMWKPWMFVFGIEKYHHGGAIYVGPIAFGLGPIDPELRWWRKHCPLSRQPANERNAK